MSFSDENREDAHGLGTTAVCADGQDTKQAYGALLGLEHLSEETNGLYPYTERFAEMISDQAWVVRCRGFRVFRRQTRWDEDSAIDRNLERALAVLEDEKPTKCC